MNRGLADERDPIASAIWRYGWAGYEPPMPELFSAVAARARSVIDVVANSGYYSLIAAASSDAVQIHSFEPFGPARDHLELNVRRSECSDKIHIHETAVSDRCGTDTLHVPRRNRNLVESSASLNSTFREQHSDAIRVQTTTLDSFVSRVGIKCVDLIKIDVESFEHQVLSGGRAVLEQHRPIVFLEVLASADLEALDRIREELDFISFRMGDHVLYLSRQVTFCESSKNQILCPREKVGVVEQIAGDLGYSVVDATALGQ